MIVIAGCLLIIWYLFLFFRKEKSDKSKKRREVRVLFIIGIIFGIVELLWYMRNLQYITLILETANNLLLLILFELIVSFVVPILIILVSIAGLLLTKKPSEISHKPKTKWGFRTILVIGIIFVIFELSRFILFQLSSYILLITSKGFWGENIVTIIFTLWYFTFGFVFPIFFILIFIAGLRLTK
jgi:hypothetical protein